MCVHRCKCLLASSKVSRESPVSTSDLLTKLPWLWKHTTNGLWGFELKSLDLQVGTFMVGQTSWALDCFSAVWTWTHDFKVSKSHFFLSCKMGVVTLLHRRLGVFTKIMCKTAQHHLSITSITLGVAMTRHSPFRTHCCLETTRQTHTLSLHTFRQDWFIVAETQFWQMEVFWFPTI